MSALHQLQLSRRWAFLGLICLGWGVAHGAELTWTALPDGPRAQSGHFAGLSDSTLILIGGSSFPVSPWQGGEKQWHGEIYSLDTSTNGAEWREIGSVPAVAYGASFSTPQGVVIAGGTDGQTVSREVKRIAPDGDDVAIDALPPLPEPVAYCGGALLGSQVVVVGGQSATDATEASNRVWALDLSNTEGGWSELPSLPRGRILPVVAASGGALYVFSGADLAPDADGNAVRTYLADGYRFDGATWTACAAPPRALVAAPAAALGPSHIAVFSGDDGTHYEETAALGDDHPGFPAENLLYHTVTDTWTPVAAGPMAVVTTTAVSGGTEIFLVAGEDRPGHRVSGAYVISATTMRGGFAAINLGVIAVYLLALIGVGAYFARREGTTDDFFLGGYRVPWWAMGLSIFGTQLSAITYLAIPARAYATDWVYVWANVGIVLVAPLIVFGFLPFYRRRRYTTAFEYLEERFNLGVRIYGACVFMLFQAGRVGIVLFLPAIALHQVTGVNVYWCILAMGVLATLYTFLGGIEAVIWTDVIQVIVLGVGAIVALVIVLTGVDGGFGTVMREAGEANKFHMMNWTWDATQAAVWICLIGNVFAVLYPYAADQTIIQRYLASQDERSAKRAVWTNAILAIPATLIFFFLGTALYVFYRHHPEALAPGQANDAIFAHFIVQQMPVGLSGLIIAAVFAAAMSSLDSSINSASTVLVHDFYRRMRKDATDQQCLRLAKALTLVLGVVGTGSAIWIAARDVQSIFAEYNKILGLTGGGLAGVVALGMWTKRTSGVGALTGAVVSAGVVYYVSNFTGIHLFLYAMIGFLSSFAVGYGVSLVVPARRD